MIKVIVHQKSPLGQGIYNLTVNFTNDAKAGTTVTDQLGNVWLVEKQVWEPFFTGMILRVKEVKK